MFAHPPSMTPSVPHLPSPSLAPSVPPIPSSIGQGHAYAKLRQEGSVSGTPPSSDAAIRRLGVVGENPEQLVIVYTTLSEKIVNVRLCMIIPK